MTTDPQPTVEERVARHLAAKEWLTTDDGWDTATPSFRADYLAHAREVIALVQPPVVPSEPADRPAILREVADICDEAGAVYTSKALNDHAGAAFTLMERFLRKADEAEYVATPCDFVACEPGGEPCSTHERLMAHAEGDHELCAPDCGTSAVEAPAPNRADSEGQQREAEVPRPAPTGPASTALRVRVLREILGRRDGSTGSGDSATEDVPAATVRSVLAEILADMQPEARPRLAAYQTCGVCNSGYPTGGSCGTCAFSARMAAHQPTA